jgi:hypothetical protein
MSGIALVNLRSLDLNLLVTLVFLNKKNEKKNTIKLKKDARRDLKKVKK